MHQCLGPCIKDEKFDYSNYKREITRFLNGDTKYIIEELNNKMQEASLNLDFEQALEYRNLINDINITTEHQKISISDLFDNLKNIDKLILLSLYNQYVNRLKDLGLLSTIKGRLLTYEETTSLSNEVKGKNYYVLLSNVDKILKNIQKKFPFV